MEPSWEPSWNLHGNLRGTFMEPSWEPSWNLHGNLHETLMETFMGPCLHGVSMESYEGSMESSKLCFSIGSGECCNSKVHVPAVDFMEGSTKVPMMIPHSAAFPRYKSEQLPSWNLHGHLHRTFMEAFMEP